MTNRLRTAVALFTMIATPASLPAGEKTSRAAGNKPIPAELSGLRERWAAALDEFCVPGLAVVVVQNDEVIYLDTFGYRDIEKKRPVTPDTQFYIASATKPFTAMGIMTLVDAGRLRLDDPVKKHLPRLELPDAEMTEKLTVRDLLCHARGINCAPVVFLDAYTGEITDDRYFQLLRRHGSCSGRPQYSNIHFTLAGRVIEAVTGKSWRDYLEEAVFKPANMVTATGYADRMYASDSAATPYELSADGLAPARHRKSDNTMHAAGGLGISIADLGRWLRLCMNNGEIDGRRVLNSSSAAEMIQLHADAPEGRVRANKGFGLAWKVGAYMPGGPVYVSHGGGYIGAGAHVSFLPEKKIGVAIVTNAGAPAAVFADQIVSIDIYRKLLNDERIPDLLPMIREEVTERLPKEKARAAETAARIASADVSKLKVPVENCIGEYANELFGTLRISRHKDGLRLRIGELEIYPAGYDGTAFTVAITGDFHDGQFDVEDDRVRAVTLRFDLGEIRFDRQQPRASRRPDRAPRSPR